MPKRSSTDKAIRNIMDWSAAQSLLRVLADSRKGLRKILVKAGGKKAVGAMVSSGEFDKELLQESCTAFTSVWLMHTQ